MPAAVLATALLSATLLPAWGVAAAQAGTASGNLVADLRCNAVEDARFGYWRDAAVADLRLARALSERGSDAADAGEGRSCGGPGRPDASPADELSQAVTDGLRAASRIASRTERAELIGRLIDALLDAGGPVSPDVMAAVEEMQASAAGDAALEAYVLAVRGRVALAGGDREAAAAYLDRSLFLEAQRPQPLRLPGLYMAMAQARPAERDVNIRHAYAALEAVRGFMPDIDPYSGASVFDEVERPVFEAAIDLELRTLPAGAGGDSGDDVGHDSGDDSGAIGRAQMILETYREVEIQQSFGDDCLPQARAIEPRDLKNDEVILYTVVLADRVELIYAVHGVTGYRRAIPARNYDRGQLTALTEAFRDGVVHHGDWREASRTLYDLLVAPIRSELAPGDNLVIVPDGVLRSIPFAALTDPSGRFLIQDMRVSLAPALDYTAFSREREGDMPRVLAASLEHGVRLSPGLAEGKLENSGKEASVAVGAAEGKPRRYTRYGLVTDGRYGTVLNSFSRRNLEDALGDRHVDILHLATHAAFVGGGKSYVVADDGAVPLSDLRRVLAGYAVRQGELDLLVLSACNTAMGDSRSSMGLAGAAVQAGTRSVLASLWEVGDEGTLALMTAFYKHYRGRAGKSEALRQAQLSLIEHPPVAGYDDPYFWAAFELIGAWR